MKSGKRVALAAGLILAIVIAAGVIDACTLSLVIQDIDLTRSTSVQSATGTTKVAGTVKVRVNGLGSLTIYQIEANLGDIGISVWGYPRTITLPWNVELQVSATVTSFPATLPFSDFGSGPELNVHLVGECTFPGSTTSVDLFGSKDTQIFPA